jgi:alginate O-acetyltransferase complex protein AlgI
MPMQALTYLFCVVALWTLAWCLRSLKGRQLLLLLACYLFYANWGVGFLSVLIASSLMNYALGALLRRRATAVRLGICIIPNLLLLSFFKYLPPLLGSAPAGSWLAEFSGQIVMPVGISFWTFQALSYLLDIYREEEVDPSLLEFCLYIAFAPTVLSGPICRLPTMLPQLRRVPSFAWDDIATGARRLASGLFMKLVVAQVLGDGLNPGEGVSAGFDQMKGGWGGVDVWLLAIGFGFQLFFDFAGYSHIVIGIARLFGIRLEENFEQPYFSTTPAAFWTRWHMSLSFWMRDYVFILLATMRRNTWWRYSALVFSMFLIGLWHGAQATFILWGIYHGLLLVMHRLGQQFKRRLSFTGPTAIGTFLSWASTFAMVSLGWIFFRAQDLNQSLAMLSALISPGSYHQLALPPRFYIVISIVVIGYFVHQALESLLTQRLARYREARGTIAHVSSWTGIADEIVVFLWQRKWWVVTPLMLVLLLYGALLIEDRPDLVGQSLVVRPFIYTLF